MSFLEPTSRVQPNTRLKLAAPFPNAPRASGHAVSSNSLCEHSSLAPQLKRNPLGRMTASRVKFILRMRARLERRCPIIR